MRDIRLRTLMGVATASLVVAAFAVPSTALATGRIAFVRNSDVWTAAADGTQVIRLTHTSADEAFPAWTPNGKSIAYVRTYYSKAKYSPQVWLMSASGGHARRLKFIEPAAGWRRTVIDGFAYSPNGKLLAIADRVTKGSSDRERVVVVNLKTKRSTIFYKLAGDFDGIGVSFARDSKHLLMNLLPTDVSDGGIAILNVSTKRVTHLAEGGLGATYSPDGMRIVFGKVVFNAGDSSQPPRTMITTMSATGASPVDVFSPTAPGVIDGPIAWNHTSSQVAFDINDTAYVLDLNSLAFNQFATNASMLAWQP